MAGFGPSTGRFVEVCETQEARESMMRSWKPPVVWALAFSVAFLCIVFGLNSIYEHERATSAILLLVAIGAVVFAIIWTVRNR